MDGIMNIAKQIKRQLFTKRDRIDKYDKNLNWTRYEYCENHGGHLSINDFDAWYCLRCWVGFFMGMAFGVSPEVKQSIMDETSHKIILDNGRLGIRRAESGIFHLSDGEEIITYEKAILISPYVKPRKNGGPPYVYELKRL